MHRRQEVLRYLANTHPHTTLPTQRQHDSGERYTMSEGLGDHVNLASFVAVPRGATPDPAKKVCGPNVRIPHICLVRHQGLCKAAEELRCTLDVIPRSMHHILRALYRGT
jgi:hypothetical protein